MIKRNDTWLREKVLAGLLFVRSKIKAPLFPLLHCVFLSQLFCIMVAYFFWSTSNPVNLQRIMQEVAEDPRSVGIERVLRLLSVRD